MCNGGGGTGNGQVRTRWELLHSRSRVCALYANIMDFQDPHLQRQRASRQQQPGGRPRDALAPYRRHIGFSCFHRVYGIPRRKTTGCFEIWGGKGWSEASILAMKWEQLFHILAWHLNTCSKEVNSSKFKQKRKTVALWSPEHMEGSRAASGKLSMFNMYIINSTCSSYFSKIPPRWQAWTAAWWPSTLATQQTLSFQVEFVCSFSVWVQFWFTSTTWNMYNRQGIPGKTLLKNGTFWNV